MREQDPDVVGLSVMTFQRRTALRLVRLIRAIKPSVTVVAGGYDPSLAPEAYEPPDSGIDFIVRGEGELTFRALAADPRERRRCRRPFQDSHSAPRSSGDGRSATRRRGP